MTDSFSRLSLVHGPIAVTESGEAWNRYSANSFLWPAGPSCSAMNRKGAPPQTEYVTKLWKCCHALFSEENGICDEIMSTKLYVEQVETKKKKNRPPTNYSYDEQPSILYEKLLFCRGKKKKYLMMLYVQWDTYWVGRPLVLKVL